MTPTISDDTTTAGMATTTTTGTEPAQDKMPAEVSENGASDATLRAAALDCERRVQALLAREPTSKILAGTQRQVRIAMGVIEDALERYGPDELSLSYNGGKDCLVLLILLLAALPRHFAKKRPTTDSTPAAADAASSTPYPATLQSVYIVSPHPFAEVDAFVDTSVTRYALDLVRFPSPMKPALSSYLGVRPAVRAVFVGTRRTDPHGERLTHFDMTDGDWPRFMRIHPVIDWHYAEIWAFIRETGVEYCPLYDQGYTSLGGTTDTLPNPALRKEAPSGDEAPHRPAYELMDDYEERLGRDR
ncbi:hypothetical protein F5X68DRAFT_194218 [Plectosphaerella plurivora]|uniref:FAD synthase n=1 Tax=Plectosphaerella plurivora TaxID=936078 RepID=A0A9P8V4A3_9PEZI|nr:hypothetical protein F5X68DRAFT_194218 [Plectosphaerella plurivora]